MNWLGLFAILAAGIVPIVLMQRNRTKPLKKRREVFWWLPLHMLQDLTLVDVQALRSLAKNRLTASSTHHYKQDFSTRRRQYLNDPAQACTCV